MKLITGGTGLLGSYLLCRFYLENIPARVLKRDTSNFFQLRMAFEFMNLGKKVSFDEFLKFFEWKDADLRDLPGLEESLEGIDEIFHLAALVSFNKDTNNDLPDVNLNGTKNLVNLAIKLKIPVFHYVSSIASLSRNNEGVMTEEFTEFNFNKATPYSKSKYLAEMEVWRGYNEGLNGVIVNPAIMLGTGDITRGSLVFYNFIKKGLAVYPVGKNGFVDVRDVADCLYLLAADKEKYNNRYLLVSNGYFYKDIFRMIATGLHLKPPRIKVTPSLTRLAYIIDNLRSKITFSYPVITKDILRLVNSIYEFDNSKVRTSLNFEFRTLEDSIKETTEFFVKNNFGVKFK
jgi:dihydroflavonol-4-reductase